MSRMLKKYLSSLENKHKCNEILGVEGSASRVYFTIFQEITPQPFEWNGRNRQPPQDPVNALLSLTYMMVLAEIVSKAYIHSFDPFIGFLHRLEYTRPSFALDILELCRSLYCDYFVFSILRKGVFDVSDFLISKSDGCHLKPEAFKRYLKEFTEFYASERDRRVQLDKFISKQILAVNDFLQASKLPDNIFK